MTYRVLGITGSRPQNITSMMHEPVRQALLERMIGFKEQGGELVLQGGCIGVDHWAAFAAHKIGIEVATYVPFPEQPDRWSDEQKDDYRKILDFSSEVKIFGDSYSTSWFFARNNAIVKDSDFMLACYPFDAGKGGSLAAAKYAWNRKPMTRLLVHPDRIVQKFHVPDDTPFPEFKK